MKYESLILWATSIDVFADALKSHYRECSEVVSRSGDARLFVIEKYYLRVNSNALGVVHIESTGRGSFIANIYAGGGRSGMLGIDYGAENQFVDEMKKILLGAEEVDMTGKGNEQYKVNVPTSQECIVCHRGLNNRDALLKCPSCGGKAHSIHMLEWLHTHDYCPSCHARITASALIPTTR